MTTATASETHGFQAEVKQLLHLMIHSLYSNREIFLRELISNASDAADKLRFEAIADEKLLEDNADLTIRIDFDSESKTLSITDNGIGMTRDDVIQQLGTIARSGTSEFLMAMSADSQKDANLIGRFGVGFYSAFIVASKVEVFTRRAGTAAGDGVHWVSDGDGEFTIETIDREERGTTVLLHLREDAEEYADDFRLRNLVRKYSDHIAFQVEMKTVPVAGDNEEAKEAEEEAEIQPEYESVNTAKALWTRPRTDVSDDEYHEFYKHISHDFQEPLLWSHNRVEGKREYTSLLYLPAKPPFDLWNRESPRGLKLYVQRVFIMDEAEQFLPLYLRFVRGIIDSNDLSLNVSRELLQQDETVEAIKGALTKRILDMFGKLASGDAEKYQSFWNEFGRVIKEGPAEDSANGEKIAGLLRFATTHTGNELQDQSLADYVSRLQEGQDKIYYVTADSHKSVSASPHLEVFRKKGIEVLLLSDPIDEWVMGHLREFDGKELRDIRRGELDLGDKDDQDKEEQDDGEHKDFLDRLREQLKDEVEEVRLTDRLTDSPACLAIGEYDMGAQMRKIIESSGQSLPESKPIFEINAEHPLIARLDAEQDEQRFGDLATVLLDQARLSEGQQLADPGAYATRLNRLLLELSG
ncbi:MAG: molecular chaperone HtpG [Gammaproteobacteria bacterium]|jgi:molecular chaperone HtpG|nr:molecular chaperone HtpG [Gammaproteobacteria bacterium]